MTVYRVQQQGLTSNLLVISRNRRRSTLLWVSRVLCQEPCSQKMSVLAVSQRQDQCLESQTVGTRILSTLRTTSIRRKRARGSRFLSGTFQLSILLSVTLSVPRLAAHALDLTMQLKEQIWWISTQKTLVSNREFCIDLTRWHVTVQRGVQCARVFNTMPQGTTKATLMS